MAYCQCAGCKTAVEEAICRRNGIMVSLSPMATPGPFDYALRAPALIWLLFPSQRCLGRLVFLLSSLSPLGSLCILTVPRIQVD